ncbi:MAG TPA: hypothetical protein VFX92_11790, partial [Candidatus Krumholzibacteria bacterium]|nr:hypothetical protein [Candidatus Krumholzibacteria bacterium]
MNARIKDYVSQILARLPARPPAVRAATEDPSAVADEIFSILTGREFCYLSRGRTAPYRETTTALLKRDIERGEPVRFYYDIGAGYHASIHPGESGLVFNVGFSELCVLAQIASFCNRVAGIYRAGARFVLVIDNLCGLVTNAIPVDDTLGYCSELRTLIEQTGMHDRVEVLVESEQFDAAGYAIDHGRLAADAAA